MGEEREQVKLVLIYAEFPSEKEVVCLSMDLISICGPMSRFSTS